MASVSEHLMPSEERRTIHTELRPPFSVLEPVQQTTPFVFCSPHSGRIYPNSFLEQSRLDPLALRKSEDAYVDELYAAAPKMGAPLLTAHFPRAYLDVNREAFELDPELFAEPLPEFANTHSVRVAGGLGTIARVVADGEDIYEHRLRLATAMERIEQLYHPFHQTLARLLTETRARFGVAILIDCHSMPSMLAAQSPQQQRPDFVIGDRFGAASDPKLTNFLSETISGLGYDVLLNRPYAGGFITENYGRPHQNLHAIQLEINRRLYLDEATIERSSGFDSLQRDLTTIVEKLFADGPALLRRRDAAE
jgi:N-formylglutamate amidohydrolase